MTTEMGHGWEQVDGWVAGWGSSAEHPCVWLHCSGYSISRYNGRDGALSKIGWDARDPNGNILGIAASPAAAIAITRAPESSDHQRRDFDRGKRDALNGDEPADGDCDYYTRGFGVGQRIAAAESVRGKAWPVKVRNQ